MYCFIKKKKILFIIPIPVYLNHDNVVGLKKKNIVALTLYIDYYWINGSAQC